MAGNSAEVREELLHATGITPKANESEEKLGLRVTKFISDKMPEDEYDKLSAEAHDWYNAALELYEENKDITLPAAANGEAQGEEEEPEATTTTTTTKGKKVKKATAAATKKTAAKKAPAKKAAAKKKAAPAPKAAKAEKETNGSPRGAVEAIIDVMCRNTNLSKEQVAERVAAKGFEIGDQHLAARYSHTKRVVEKLGELGKLA